MTAPRKRDCDCDGWTTLVRENLSALDLPHDAREAVIAELAAHLEDSEDTDESAEISWRGLKHAIEHAKHKEDQMNHRTKALWLPGLASLAAANLFLLVLTRFSLQPESLIHLNSGLARTLYLGWIFAQVFFGALGAYLSRRLGGTRTARVIAAAFPAIVTFGLWVLVIPVSAVAQHNIFVLRHSLYYALGIFPLVVLPTMALLLGAAPILKEQKLAAA
jgi:hypothetical protein